MEKQEIFSQVAELEEKLGQLYKEVGLLKQKVVTLLEDNHNLHIENEQLRQRLEGKIAEQPEDKEEQEKESNTNQPIGEGYDNLARLYQEGFHVCNLHYGSLRTEGDCLFCLSFLNKS